MLLADQRVEIKPTLIEKRNAVPRPDLFGWSNLATLPVIAPEIPLASLALTEGRRTVVRVGEVEIGGTEIILMAGPCSLENETQIWETARAARHAGAKILRGGAFKPRTSVYSFQGLGERGLQIQRQAADNFTMLVVTEATGERNLPIVAKYADIIQVGARNSQNFELLAAIGLIAKELDKGVLYKRGPWMSLKEWLEGAEYLLAAGLPIDKLILCERGTIKKDGKVDFDDQGVVDMRKLTHLPIIGDPTHATKLAVNVPCIAQRAISAGVDGLLIELHSNPSAAKVDGPRALLPEQLKELMSNIVIPEGRWINRPN